MATGLRAASTRLSTHLAPPPRALKGPIKHLTTRVWRSRAPRGPRCEAPIGGGLGLPASPDGSRTPQPALGKASDQPSVSHAVATSVSGALASTASRALALVRSALMKYDELLTTRPVLTKSLTSCIGFAIGDRLAQSIGGGFYDPWRWVPMRAALPADWTPAGRRPLTHTVVRVQGCAAVSVWPADRWTRGPRLVSALFLCPLLPPPAAGMQSSPPSQWQYVALSKTKSLIPTPGTSCWTSTLSLTIHEARVLC